MNRTTHDVQQGTGPWLRLREGFDTASEAPAALGVGKYTTRAELMRRKHTGIAEEHSQATLAKFRAGHEAEARARPLAEATIGGVELFPVTMSLEVAGLRLLASLDGLSLDGETAWETKLWNEELAAHVRAGTLPEHYTVQMDQELFVSGARRCLFTCTDGTSDRFERCWYDADPAKFEALIDGWIQFRRDLAAYALPESAPSEPVGRAPEALPALRVEVTGQVTASNLSEFKATALGAIRAVNRTLKTDQDFADAAKAVKWCEDVESRIAAVKEHALSQTASIDALFKTLDDISAEARAVRLDLGKLQARRKDEVKAEAVSAARRALDEHIAALQAELAPLRLQPVAADFAGCLKGLRSVASMQDALDAALASAKIAADSQARVIRGNVATFKAEAAGFEFLFADLVQVVHKAADDFAALVASRIATHRAAEAERERKRAEAEQAHIAAEAKRLADEQIRQAQAAAAVPAAPMAAPAQQPVLAAPAAPAPIVKDRSTIPVPRLDDPATLKLGDIADRLGFALRAEFVGSVLGVQPAGRNGAATLYREAQFAQIVAALQVHLVRVLRGTEVSA